MMAEEMAEDADEVATGVADEAEVRKAATAAPPQASTDLAPGGGRS